jgi:hypothetical protein
MGGGRVLYMYLEQVRLWPAGLVPSINVSCIGGIN